MKKKEKPYEFKAEYKVFGAVWNFYKQTAAELGEHFQSIEFVAETAVKAAELKAALKVDGLLRNFADGLFMATVEYLAVKKIVDPENKAEAQVFNTTWAYLKRIWGFDYEDEEVWTEITNIGEANLKEAPEYARNLARKLQETVLSYAADNSAMAFEKKVS